MKRSWKLVGLLLCLGSVTAATASVGNGSPAKGDQPAKVTELLLQASKGNIAAEMKLANIYYGGIGVQKDLARAFAWYMRCAEQGNPDAQAYVGLMYARGIGVDRNLEHSLEWLRRSSAQGSPRGEFQLALMYIHGYGTEDERKQLRALIAKSAAQDYAPAEAQLGFFAYAGDGVAVDHHQALRYFLMAAYDSNVFADYYAAKMYSEGDGVKRDNFIAYTLTENGIEHPKPGTPADLDQIKDLQKRLETELSKKDLADAKKIVSDANFTGQSFVNALAWRTYAATGKSLLGDDDPLHDPGIGPVVINIDDKGAVFLFGRAVDLPTLKQRLGIFFKDDPWPDARILIKGFPLTLAAIQSASAVEADIDEMKLKNFSRLIQVQFGSNVVKRS